MYMPVGCSPVDEPQVTPGSLDYKKRAIKECEKFIKFIQDKMGKEPESAHLAIKNFNDHYQVVCYYTNDEGFQYYRNIKNNLPLEWEE